MVLQLPLTAISWPSHGLPGPGIADAFKRFFHPIAEKGSARRLESIPAIHRDASMLRLRLIEARSFRGWKMFQTKAPRFVHARSIRTARCSRLSSLRVPAVPAPVDSHA